MVGNIPWRMQASITCLLWFGRSRTVLLIITLLWAAIDQDHSLGASFV